MSDNITLHKSDCALLLGGYQCTCGFHQQNSKTLPALAAETPKHPGYIIGSHWLETAYSRICAGEAEADVLRDIGLVREEAFLTGVAHLKAENERLLEALQDIAQQPEGDEDSAQAVAKAALRREET